MFAKRDTRVQEVEMSDTSANASVDLEHTRRSELAATIELRLHDIEHRWLERVRQELLTDGDSIATTDLKDAMGEYLCALAKAIRGDATIEAGGGAAWADVAREHGLTRVRLGFDIGQLVNEFILLRKSMVEIAREEHLVVNDGQGERLADLIDAAIAVSVKSYVESRDIATRRQQAEHVGFLTHELRNPLATASMAASRLRRRPELIAAEGKTLDMLERGLARLRDLIDKVLLTERFEAQEMECRPVDTNLGRIIPEAIRAAQFEAGQKGVTFVAEYDPELLVHVDPGLTSSALQNIVDNAVKFTDEGRIDLTVESGSSEVIVRIQDDCDGLSADELTAVFQPFKRANTKKAGTGLGLAIARRAVEAQGGRIGAESDGERGCQFWLTLPKPSQ
jgi:signal transduction histidine kinase